VEASGSARPAAALQRQMGCVSGGSAVAAEAEQWAARPQRRRNSGQRGGGIGNVRSMGAARWQQGVVCGCTAAAQRQQ
jgi:hypothetical protein